MVDEIQFGESILGKVLWCGLAWLRFLQVEAGPDFQSRTRTYAWHSIKKKKAKMNHVAHNAQL